MQNEHGIECPVDWGDVDSKIQYVAVHPNGKIVGFGKQPILKDDIFAVNFWDCQMDETVLISLGDYKLLHDVSKHIWQRPQP